MKRFLLSTICLSALAAGSAFAQGQADTPRAREPARTEQSENDSQQLNQHAAACLLIGNQEEIALSNFGIQNAESDEVKEFARDMVKEHTKFVSKLRKFAPQSGSFELKVSTSEGGAQAGDREQASEREVRTSVRAGETTAAKVGGAGGKSFMDQLLAIEHDKAQHCLDLTKKGLQEHQGKDFDKAFMSAQVSAHIGMLAKLKALDGKVSGELADLVAEGESATQEHLDHAKQIKEKLASAQGRGAGREGAAREGGAREGARPRVRDNREPRSPEAGPPATLRPRSEGAAPRRQ